MTRAVKKSAIVVEHGPTYAEPLTLEERQSVGVQLGLAYKELEVMKERWRDVSSEHRAEVAKLESHISMLAEEARTGVRKRPAQMDLPVDDDEAQD